MTEIQREIARKARDAALAYLAARAHSVHEMRAHLRRKGYAADVIQRTVGDLERLRLLDDRAFARDWVEARLRSRPVGPVRLARDLHDKGVSEEIAEDTLAAYAAQLNSTEMALRVLHQRRRRYAGLDETVARRRLLALLARRGYQHDTARAAVNLAWEEWQRNEGK